MPKSTRIDRVVFDSGERFPMLLGEDGVPVILPMRYMVLELREKNQWRTIEAHLRAIGWFYDWSFENDVELESRLRYGAALTSSEMTQFCQYIRAGRVAHNVISSIARHENAPSPATVISYEDAYKGNALAALISGKKCEVRWHERFSSDRIKNAWSALIQHPELSSLKNVELIYQGKLIV